MATIQDMILSEDYADYIVPVYPRFLENYRDYGAQLFNAHLGMVHALLPSSDIRDYYAGGLEYNTIPKLYSLLDTVSLDASQITTVQNQPALNLQGRNVLIGVIDTGIDYTHPAFRFSDGRSRIAGLWDQTLQEGTAPYDLQYGSGYTQEDINMALTSENPRSIVPSTDTNGHGTFLAGVAAGSRLPDSNFTGAAPGSLIAVVKLKEAKQYLRQLFFHTSQNPVYQETDIMMGIRYLLTLAAETGYSLVICLGMGTNQGAHSGQSSLSSIFGEISNYRGVYNIVSAGNESGMAHHFAGNAPAGGNYMTAEIIVPENTEGFTVELWGRSPSVYSVGFESPLGEFIQKLPTRISFQDTVNFVLENTQIFVSSEVIQTISGDQLIFMRFIDPTPGSWKIRIYTDLDNGSPFHMWLPITGFTDTDLIFLRSNPDTTLTDPSTSPFVITSATYNAYNNGIFLNSSRGFTRIGLIKPDITSPGVDVFGPTPGGRFSTMTGSSVAAAITAGACALIAEWGANRTPPRVLNSTEMKSLLIRGAKRSPDRNYPNQEWGYGILDVYRVFSVFASL